jgi:hypothetical protein
LNSGFSCVSSDSSAEGDSGERGDDADERASENARYRDHCRPEGDERVRQQV